MSLSFMTQAACLAAVCVAGAYYLASSTEVEASLVEEDSVQVQGKPSLPKGSVVSIPRSNGQFFTQGKVNSGSVRFLIDTGASAVALTLEDARKSGINISRLNYTTRVQTANGEAMAAPVNLKEVRIGGVRVRNVRGLVIRDGLNTSLLGMTFLGELQKVEVLPNQMILRR